MDYSLREWVRLARQHGSIAQAAVTAQANESGVTEETLDKGSQPKIEYNKLIVAAFAP